MGTKLAIWVVGSFAADLPYDLDLVHLILLTKCGFNNLAGTSLRVANRDILEVCMSQDRSCFLRTALESVSTTLDGRGRCLWYRTELMFADL